MRTGPLLFSFRKAAVLGLFLLIGPTPFDTVYAQKSAASPGQGGGQAGSPSGAAPYFETEMLAYGGINQLSEAIGQRVCGSPSIPAFVPADGTIVIFDQTSFQNLGAWQSMVAGAEALGEAYKTLLSQSEKRDLEAVVPPPNQTRGATSTNPSFIQGGADLGALISAIAASATNSASTFSIPDSAMAVSLLHEFKRINCNVNLIYYPLFGAYADLGAATFKVKTALNQLNQIRGIVQEDIVTDTVNGANTGSARYAILSDLNSQYDALLRPLLSNSNQSIGGNNPAQSQSSSGGAQQNNGGTSGPVGYTSFVQGAELEELIQRDNTYILYADIVAAGGTQRDLKNIFTLFTGDWISYSGGLIVNVALIKSKDTTLEFAGTLRYRSKFAGFTKPTQSSLVESTNSGSNPYTLCNEEGPGRSNKPSANGCPVTAETLGSLTFDQHEVIGGARLIGTIALTSPAGASGVDVGLKSDNEAFPDTTVKVPAKSTVANFSVTTKPVSDLTTIHITASYSGNTTNPVDLTIDPPSLSSLRLDPDEVPAGVDSEVIGTISLNGVAADVLNGAYRGANPEGSGSKTPRAQPDRSLGL